MTSCAHALVRLLEGYGVESVFGIPGVHTVELYRGLQDIGVPSKLILYNGFGHPITKPKSNRAVLQHNLDWFSHYVWGDAIPADSPLRGNEE